MPPFCFKLLVPALFAGVASWSGAGLAQSLEEMAGQMIVVGFAGDTAAAETVKALQAEIAAGEIGGVMYLRSNVSGLAEVAAMNDAFRAASPERPPFITLDQEGGAVERLTAKVGFKEIPNAWTVAAGNTPEEAGQIYGEMAQGVAELGFTVNFGPVVDLNLNPDNPIIAKYGRAFGTTAGRVAPYARAFIEAHHKAGLLTALKHFPGHGSSAADSHEGFVDITNTWLPTELLPYRELIAAGLADMVMVGHLIHTGYSELPSSLAPQWITGVLRGELGFDGVVISDDLEMGAIREHFSLEETVTRAVRAGMDVLLFSNTSDPRPTLGDEIRAILVAEAEKDPEFRDRIAESYKLIVALKARIGK